MKGAIQKILAGTLTAAMFFTPISYATDEGSYSFDNFKVQQEYNDNTFKDVTAPWMKDAVKTSYELGLMNGRGNNTFKPNDNMTLAEAIYIAVQIHDIYTGGDGTIEKAGSAWYDGAVLYALDHDIIQPGTYTNFQKNATRAQMADIFVRALPEGGYGVINQIDTLPDVTSDTSGSESIFTLYRAGILSGSDEYGTFHPASTIRRSEAAVIVARIADPSLRKSVVLRPASIKNAKETTYTAKSNRFKLTTPKAWKEAGIYSSAYNSLELFGAGDLQRITVIESAKKQGDTLKSFSDNFIADMKESLKVPTVYPYASYSLNDADALSCIVTGTLSEVPMSFHFVLVDGGDRYFIINGCTPQNTDTAFAEQFQNIVQSFTLVK